jgi:ubiquinone biosynthesis protein
MVELSFKQRSGWSVIGDTWRGYFVISRGIAWGTRPLLSWIAGFPLSSLEIGIRLKCLLEELGITGVKIGQYFAMRPDLLPAEICGELSKLFASVHPLSLQTVLRQVEEQLGCQIEENFSEFSSEPVGSASVAQVHRAITKRGERVAVKVRRPDVEQTLRADIRILRAIAALADKLGLFGPMSMRALLEEVARFTLREIDFRLEGNTAERLRNQSFPGIHVPKIYWDMTTDSVLTMEFMKGNTLEEIIGGDYHRAGPGRQTQQFPPDLLRESVYLIAKASLTQIFVDGFFHGDPHPANIIILEGGGVAFIDFGIFGEFDKQQRETLAAYIGCIARGDVERAYTVGLRLNDMTMNTDPATYRNEAISVMRRWRAAALDPRVKAGGKLVAKFEIEMLDVMRRHSVVMRPNQLLFWRVLSTLDATSQRLPIEFDLLAVLREFFDEGAAYPIDQIKQLLLFGYNLKVYAGRSVDSVFGIKHELLRGSITAVLTRKESDSRRRFLYSLTLAAALFGVCAALLLSFP